MRTSIRLPAGTVVSKLLKKAGDVLAFGEPVALLTTSTSQTPTVLVSPLVGLVREINSQVQPGGEFATFEGRRPLIGFRHLKHSLLHVDAAPQSVQSTPPPRASLGPAPALLFPANFGRLPPLTDKESSLLHSGLATDAW
ncbi:hypothetical protein BASA81_013764 [Batrachochytrium salamandrivorans]|nr:hypothetical protein BASA81_013764 [Batrachochytrium salamandrivorans]